MIDNRLLDVPGTHNLRDVGGYAASGGTIRWRKLLRSDALHQVDDTGRTLLRELGLALVIDLRHEGEIELAPNALDGVGHLEERVPIVPDHESASLTGAGVDLVPVYADFVDRRGEALTRAVRLIAGSGDRPVLVHCTAGKDRTGLVVALALSAVSVDRTQVIEDYAESESNLAGPWVLAMADRIRAHGLEVDDGFLATIAASPVALMRDTLAAMDHSHGGPTGYLRAHGMTDIELDRLRDVLVASHHHERT